MVKLLIRLSGKRSEILKWILFVLCLGTLFTQPDMSTLNNLYWRFIKMEHPDDTRLLREIVKDLPNYAVPKPTPSTPQVSTTHVEEKP